MDPSQQFALMIGQQTRTASGRIIYEYGEERASRRIDGAIVMRAAVLLSPARGSCAALLERVLGPHRAACILPPAPFRLSASMSITTRSLQRFLEKAPGLLPRRPHLRTRLPFLEDRPVKSVRELGREPDFTLQTVKRCVRARPNR